MTSDLLVKRLMLQASVSVLAGLLLSSAAMAEDNTGDAGDPDISIAVDGPDVSIDPLVMRFKGPDVSIDPVEIGVEGPDASLDQMEIGGIPAEVTMAAVMSQTDEAAASRDHDTSRGEGRATGSGYIWTRSESLR